MKRRALTALLVIIATLGCTKEKREIVADATKGASQTVADRFESSVPIVGQRASREELERERFSAEWRRLRSFRAAVARKAAAVRQAAMPKINFVVDPKFGESFKGFDPAGLQNLPVRVPIKGDVAGPSVLRAQVLLDRIGYSVGAIDGRWGKNSEIAVYFFQRENNIDATGDIDQRTFEALAAAAQNPPALVRYAVTAEDVKGPFTKIPEDVYDKERLECLCYESLGEKLAEKSHSTVELLARLNPGVDLDSLQAGQQITVANVRPWLDQDIGPDVMKIVVSVRGNYLHGLDGQGNVLFHAPTTVGGKYDPSPSETVTLKGIKHDPNFHYQPKLFHEVPDSEPEAHLKAGPNSPVGVVWMALSKPHYGIHGTSEPDTIGYASSHGCVRLANWDANFLSRRAKTGIDVAFVDTKGEPAG